jgi:sugar phosphate isomerase/epimerase
MGNFVLENVEPLSAYEKMRDYVAYFHIKDALYEGAIVPPGKGEAKIKEIIEAHNNYAKNDFFITLEPHLQTFSGLNALVGREFDNPYKYDDEKTAFTDAVIKLKELLL